MVEDNSSSEAWGLSRLLGNKDERDLLIQKRLERVLEALEKDPKKAEKYAKKFISLYVKPGEKDPEIFLEGITNFLLDSMFKMTRVEWMEKCPEEEEHDDDIILKYDLANTFQLARLVAKFWPGLKIHRIILTTMVEDVFEGELTCYYPDFDIITDILEECLVHWKSDPFVLFFVSEYLYECLKHDMNNSDHKGLREMREDSLADFFYKNEIAKALHQFAPEALKKLHRDFDRELYAEKFGCLFVYKGIRNTLGFYLEIKKLIDKGELEWTKKTESEPEKEVKQEKEDPNSSFFDDSSSEADAEKLPNDLDLSLEEYLKKKELSSIRDKWSGERRMNSAVAVLKRLESSDKNQNHRLCGHFKCPTLVFPEKRCQFTVKDVKNAKINPKTEFVPKVFIRNFGNSIEINGQNFGWREMIGKPLADGDTISMGQNVTFKLQYLPLGDEYYYKIPVKTPPKYPQEKVEVAVDKKVEVPVNKKVEVADDLNPDQSGPSGDQLPKDATDSPQVHRKLESTASGGSTPVSRDDKIDLKANGEPRKLEMLSEIVQDAQGKSQPLTTKPVALLKSMESSKMSYPLHRESSLVIGRSAKKSNVIVKDPKVSRNHAAIDFEGDVAKIYLLSSENSMTINGRKIGYQESGVPLVHGDKIKIGSETFQFDYLDFKLNLESEKTDGKSQTAQPSPVPPPAPKRSPVLICPEPILSPKIENAEVKKPELGKVHDFDNQFIEDPKHKVRKDKQRREEKWKKQQGFDPNRKPVNPGQKFHGSEKIKYRGERTPHRFPKQRDLYREQGKYLDHKPNFDRTNNNNNTRRAATQPPNPLKISGTLNMEEFFKTVPKDPFYNPHQSDEECFNVTVGDLKSNIYQDLAEFRLGNHQNHPLTLSSMKRGERLDKNNGCPQKKKTPPKTRNSAAPFPVSRKNVDPPQTPRTSLTTDYDESDVIVEEVKYI